MPHRRRPAHAARHPLHVTLRVRPGLASLRTRRAHAALLGCLRRVRGGEGLRVVHYSAMSNHVHLIVEARDRVALARGMQGLAIRFARALNRTLGRAGRVFADRYHARVLRTPLEIRRALAYVLNNARRHGFVGARVTPEWLDPFSSAAAFDGWKAAARPLRLVDRAVSRARVWLLRIGWRRYGLLSPAYIPG